jgi:branched-chain amino acid transport system permease protein
MAGGVALVFALYQWGLPNAAPQLSDFVAAWMPLSTVNQCIIWATFAIGLNIVVGYAGLLDLGYVAFWAFGGYTAGWFMSPYFTRVRINVFGNAPVGLEPGIHLNFWLVLPIAGLICALAGVIIGAPTLRLKSDYLALVTMAFGEIIPELARNNPGGITNGDKGITPIDPIPLGPFSWIPGVPKVLGPFDLSYKFIVYAFILSLAIFISLRLRDGRLGRAWLAIREDELAASMMGVPLMQTKLASYAVGAFIGGLGGVAYATHTNQVGSADFAFSASINLLAMVVLGGMGNVWGVLAGALVLSWINSNGLQQTGTAINGTFGTDIDFSSYNFLIFGLILILMMLFRREGLLPETRTKLVLHEADPVEAEALGTDLEGVAR